ncbi:LPXTG cell wall anchor domain-containing protein [Leucobacter chromiireducens]|uniref:LPXTG cell wall anchor domain-containing protein n=1 Tax=Leucobacter chromiireducens TaxID=283877 RepID=UPI003CD05AFA
MVSNPLKQINPDKDVVAKAGGKDSIDGTEIKLNSEFNYLLNSSTIPADRAYKASQWSIIDKFDRVHDQYTGIWAVYASTDVYDGEELVFKKGDLIQSSETIQAVPADGAETEAEAPVEYFKAVFDEEKYTFSIEALPAYLDLVNSRGDLEQQFSVYTKMIRIAPAEEVVNVFDESYNGVIRKSDKVVTRTPENPAIDIEKYTLDEGLKKGDRDTLEEAYGLTVTELKEGVKVGFRITNTGDVPLQNVKFGDVTINGTKGEVEDITCDLPELGTVKPTDLTTLAVGESIDCTGILQGMQKGDIHTDNATVTAESVYTKKKVSDEDPWNAKAPEKDPAPLAKTGGAGLAGLAGAAIALLGGGAGLAFYADRRGRARNLQDAENGGATE